MRILDSGCAAESVCVSRLKVLVVGALLLAAVAIGATASSASSTTRSEKQLVSLNHQIALAINTFRRAHGLASLRVSRKLNAAARQHSMEMGADGYFDHPSADGTAFWKRIQSYYSNEELLVLDGRREPPLVVARHGRGRGPEVVDREPSAPRATCSNPNWRNVGVSSVHVIDAGGVYGGSDVTIVTTDFGARH